MIIREEMRRTERLFLGLVEGRIVNEKSDCL